MSERVGVYVHVPFCPSVCPYCDFNVLVRKRPQWDAFAEALLRELDSRAALFPSYSLASIYFGGGTPSLAPASWIEEVKVAIEERFGGEPAEVTLEVNPGTVDRGKLEAYEAMGINRVSLGFQSADDSVLATLGRRHTAAQGLRTARDVRDAGIASASLDLIFAVPGQTLDMLEHDLQAVVELSPEHVSLYALTFHERTPFYRRRARGEVAPVTDDLEAQMMDRIHAVLCAEGYEHYEVSNFARPGHRAVHNGLYWSGVPYLGLGPGAHSFVREQWARGWRWEGVRSFNRYLAAWSARRVGLPVSGDASVSFVETLGARQLASERALVGLRTTDGVDLAAPPLNALEAGLTDAAPEAVARGWATREGSRLLPTYAGLQHADALAALFF